MSTEANDSTAVDLDAVATTDGGAAPHAPQPTTIDYDPSEDREHKRGQIALWLIWLLAFIVIGGMLLSLGPFVCTAIAGKESATCKTLSIDDVKTVIETLLTPIVGLVGAVTGFYFGKIKD